MKVFVSWSGNRSKAVAEALRTWLPDVFPGLETWMSAGDIEAGARWGDDLNTELESTDFGVLCLTPENLDSKWVQFEAGALGKAVKKARVVPYCVDLGPADLTFPLAQFQAVRADEDGTLKLLTSINEHWAPKRTDEQLHRAFDKWWPDLAARLAELPQPEGPPKPERPERELLEEILQAVRQRPMGDRDTVTGRVVGARRKLADLRSLGTRELDLLEKVLAHLGGIDPDTLSVLFTVRSELEKRGEEARVAATPPDITGPGAVN